MSVAPAPLKVGWRDSRRNPTLPAPGLLAACNPRPAGCCRPPLEVGPSARNEGGSISFVKVGLVVLLADRPEGWLSGRAGGKWDQMIIVPQCPFCVQSRSPHFGVLTSASVNGLGPLALNGWRYVGGRTSRSLLTRALAKAKASNGVRVGSRSVRCMPRLSDAPLATT